MAGAYESLFWAREAGYLTNNILLIANYIQWHMQKFFMIDKKAVDKFIKLVGEEFYGNLLILNECDRMAH